MELCRRQAIGNLGIAGLDDGELNRVLALPDVRQQLGARMDIVGGSSASFAAYIKSETERLNRITQDAGLTFD